MYACYGVLLFLLEVWLGMCSGGLADQPSIWIKLLLALCKQCHSLPLPILVESLRFSRATLVPQSSLCGLSLYSLFCSSCSVVSQVSLRRIYLNIYKCAFDVFMGGRSTTYSYGAIWTHLPGYFNIEKPLL